VVEATSRLWGENRALTRLTFHGVSFVFSMAGTDLASLPGERIIGLNDFAVRIASGCSGAEGMALVAVFMGIYAPDAAHGPLLDRSVSACGQPQLTFEHPADFRADLARRQYFTTAGSRRLPFLCRMAFVLTTGLSGPGHRPQHGVLASKNCRAGC